MHGTINKYRETFSPGMSEKGLTASTCPAAAFTAACRSPSASVAATAAAAAIWLQGAEDDEAFRAPAARLAAAEMELEKTLRLQVGSCAWHCLLNLSPSIVDSLELNLHARSQAAGNNFSVAPRQHFERHLPLNYLDLWFHVGMQHQQAIHSR